jgi:tetratricopeptide (TPR) repeat protein
MKVHPLLGALLLGMACLSRPALADDAATAEALFVEARQLMAQGNYAEACAKLDMSNRLDPATGTLLTLALCDERLGKTATAWALYLQIASSPRSDRAVFAQQRAAALAPTLSKLTIQATNVPANAQVTRDGVAVPASALGVAIPIDPGHHVIEAAAAGRVRFHREVALASGASMVVLVVLPAP